MSDAWLAFLVVFAMLLAIWRIADGRERPMTKSEQERMFFRQTYSLSIDRMLSESPPSSSTACERGCAGSRTAFSAQDVLFPHTTADGLQSFGGHRSPRSPSTSPMTKNSGSRADGQQHGAAAWPLRGAQRAANS